MEASTHDKALRGIRPYLERRGYDILEEGWTHGNDRTDFVATDKDEGRATSSYDTLLAYPTLSIV